MKHSQPRTEKGIDSYNDVFQKTEKPISKNTIPVMKRNIDRKSERLGKPGFRSGGGGLGSNLGVFVI